MADAKHTPNQAHTIACMDSWARDKALPTWSELLAALTELRACKALKDSAKTENSAHEAGLTMCEYRERQPRAWAAADAAIAKATGSAS
jgi:benzoyl-CoA reductase/2-hydroxyglutaryl-CoA dehydratase subunit BcrC/BadD/HgdB